MGPRGFRVAWGLVPWGLGAALLLAAGGASAQTVDEARSLYLEADFQEAVGAFEAVLDSPGLGHADAIEALRYLATLKQMLGDPEAARRHAAAAAALDPRVEAPEGAPPEVEAMLREAAVGDVAAALLIRAEGALAPGQAARIVARVEPTAPRGLVDALRLRCAGSDGEDSATAPEESGPPPEVSVNLEVGEDVSGVDCEAGAYTRAGARLLHATEHLAVGGDVLGPDEGADDGDSAAVWPWIAAGAGAAVLAGVIIVIVAASGGADQASFGPTRVEGW